MESKKPLAPSTFRWKCSCFVRASASLRERVRRDIAGRWGDKRGWPGADHPSAARAVVVVPGCEASPPGKIRSEEHTSELQSLMRISYAVFCLKKKKQKQYCTRHTD